MLLVQIFVTMLIIDPEIFRGIAHIETFFNQFSLKNKKKLHLAHFDSYFLDSY